MQATHSIFQSIKLRLSENQNKFMSLSECDNFIDVEDDNDHSISDFDELDDKLIKPKVEN